MLFPSLVETMVSAAAGTSTQAPRQPNCSSYCCLQPAPSMLLLLLLLLLMLLCSSLAPLLLLLLFAT